jgi:hypothetical protein
MPTSKINELRAQLVSTPYTRLLAEHETALANLYGTFAIILTDESAFWQKLAREEQTHCKLIMGIQEKFKNGSWRFKRPSIVTSSIADSIEWIQTLQRDAESNGISMYVALQMAVKLERGALEGMFYDSVESDTTTMLEVMRSLEKHTRAHLRRVETEATKLKWQILGRKKQQMNSASSRPKA